MDQCRNWYKKLALHTRKQQLYNLLQHYAKQAYNPKPPLLMFKGFDILFSKI
jgi:hypothetical protein